MKLSETLNSVRWVFFPCQHIFIVLGGLENSRFKYQKRSSGLLCEDGKSKLPTKHALETVDRPMIQNGFHLQRLKCIYLKPEADFVRAVPDSNRKNIGETCVGVCFAPNYYRLYMSNITVSIAQSKAGMRCHSMRLWSWLWHKFFFIGLSCLRFWHRSLIFLDQGWFKIIVVSFTAFCFLIYVTCVITGKYIKIQNFTCSVCIFGIATFVRQ